MPLVPHPQIGLFHEEIWPAGWQAQNRYLKILNVLLLIIKQKFVVYALVAGDLVFMVAVVVGVLAIHKFKMMG